MFWPLLILSFIYGSMGRSVEIKTPTFVDEPKNCWTKQAYPCAVRFLNYDKISWEQVRVIGRYGSSFVAHSASKMQVLDGRLIIDSDRTIEIEEGLNLLKFSGEVWLERLMPKRLLIRNLNAHLTMGSSLNSAEVILPAGFENWVSMINTENEIERGVTQAIAPQLFFPLYTRFIQADKATTARKLAQFRKAWGQNMKVSAQSSRKAVQRQIATLQEREERLQNAIEREKAERQKLRKMFRERHLSPSLAE